MLPVRFLLRSECLHRLGCVTLLCSSLRHAGIKTIINSPEMRTKPAKLSGLSVDCDCECGHLAEGTALRFSKRRLIYLSNGCARPLLHDVPVL
ncbi:uncharacterized protein BDW70DRAFT_34637 [Aspergillus foveolatus]|uniref:uncharacterized protein n=1 Tax=Aspergillus foveolatus TaxID=210207 RepID=UPI003CCD648C